MAAGAGLVTGGPLSGLRVLELGHYVAAPFCTRLLADLGADVIKVEPPGGDPVRGWGVQVDGRSAWWSVHGRNKRCIVLDLKTPGGRDRALRLLARCDALVENFRPGQLARLGLDDAALQAARPGLVVARISGYGQDGPYRDRASFGVIGEALGGLRYLSNHPPEDTDLPPVRVGISLGDSVAGLYAAFGLVAAVWRRDAAGGGDGRPRTLDVALNEAVFSLLDGTLPEYAAAGVIRRPAGGAIGAAAPSNAYRTQDGVWLLVAANSQPLFTRLATVMGRPELLADPRFAQNEDRVRHRPALDAVVAGWAAAHPAAELEAALEAANIPCCRAATIADCAADPQFRARGMVRDVHDPLIGPMLHPGIVPLVPEDPGAVRWPGPAVGAHDAEVFAELLGEA